MRRSDEIIFIGLSITSSWRNSHACTYRSLIRGLHRRGHKVLFLERDQPCYASNRDTAIQPYCQARLYTDLEELRARFTPRIRAAAVVIVGSAIDDGRRVCDWVLEHAAGMKVFYDMDTSATLARLGNDNCEYLAASQIPEFDLILSRTGGPALSRLEREFGARNARTLFCSVDIEQPPPSGMRRDVELGYVGAYDVACQPALDGLLIETARRRPKQRFVVVGAEYPAHLAWPRNVQRIDHMALGSHAKYYGRQRFTLNPRHADGGGAGRAPSVRLLAAAACGTPIISEEWDALGELFEPGKEILVARSTEDVVGYLDNVSDEHAGQIAAAARERVRAEHSSERRAEEFESYLGNAAARMASKQKVLSVSGRVVAAT